MPFRIPAVDVAAKCAVLSGAIGGMTLNGVLSAIASAVAIVVGGLQIYDWIKRRRKR